METLPFSRCRDRRLRVEDFTRSRINGNEIVIPHHIPDSQVLSKTSPEVELMETTLKAET